MDRKRIKNNFLCKNHLCANQYSKIQFSTNSSQKEINQLALAILLEI